MREVNASDLGEAKLAVIVVQSGVVLGAVEAKRSPPAVCDEAGGVVNELYIAHENATLDARGKVGQREPDWPLVGDALASHPVPGVVE